MALVIAARIVVAAVAAAAAAVIAVVAVVVVTPAASLSFRVRRFANEKRWRMRLHFTAIAADTVVAVAIVVLVVLVVVAVDIAIACAVVVISVIAFVVVFAVIVVVARSSRFIVRLPSPRRTSRAFCSLARSALTESHRLVVRLEVRRVFPKKRIRSRVADAAGSANVSAFQLGGQYPVHVRNTYTVYQVLGRESRPANKQRVLLLGKLENK